jgi:hypothetical protein
MVVRDEKPDVCLVGVDEVQVTTSKNIFPSAGRLGEQRGHNCTHTYTCSAAGLVWARTL